MVKYYSVGKLTATSPDIVKSVNRAAKYPKTSILSIGLIIFFETQIPVSFPVRESRDVA